VKIIPVIQFASSVIKLQGGVIWKWMGRILLFKVIL